MDVLQNGRLKSSMGLKLSWNHYQSWFLLFHSVLCRKLDIEEKVLELFCEQ